MMQRMKWGCVACNVFISPLSCSCGWRGQAIIGGFDKKEGEKKLGVKTKIQIQIQIQIQIGKVLPNHQTQEISGP